MNNLDKQYRKFKSLVHRVLSFHDEIICNYYKKTRKYTNTGKIALCCIARMENDYIRFYVEYYKKLGFDKIFIYDNNDPEGEKFEDVIEDYINSKFVEIIDYRGRKVVQISSYKDCYHKHNKEYDWIAFFDCDEFLTFANEDENIHTFLKKELYKPFQVVHINWKIYGDNDMLDNDGRNIVDRLKEPILPLDLKATYNNIPENYHVKSIVRGGLYGMCKKWNNPHTPISNFYICCNTTGAPADINSPFQPYDYNIAYIRHYVTKTIGEYVRNKMLRGFPDSSKEKWSKILNLDYFFLRNKKTEEKIIYAEHLLDKRK